VYEVNEQKPIKMWPLVLLRGQLPWFEFTNLTEGCCMLLNQGFLVAKLKSLLQKFYLTITEYQCHKWPRKCSFRRNHNPVLSEFMTYH